MPPTAQRLPSPRGLRIEDAWRAQAEMFGEAQPLWQVAPEPEPEPEPTVRKHWLGWLLPMVAIGMVGLVLGLLGLLSMVAVGLALLQ